MLSRDPSISLTNMTRAARTENKFSYKYHVTGTINDVPIDKKYCSYSGFLQEYGGEKTPLNLDRWKLSRLIHKPITKESKNKETQLMKKLWKLTFKPISEPREFKLMKQLVQPMPMPVLVPDPVPDPVSDVVNQTNLVDIIRDQVIAELHKATQPLTPDQLMELFKQMPAVVSSDLGNGVD